MKKQNALNTELAVPATTLAALAGVLLFTLLLVLANPPGYASRLASAEANAQSIDRLRRANSTRSMYPAGTVCSASVTNAVDTVRARLQSIAAGANVSLVGVALTPGAPEASFGGLTPISVQFEAHGQYDAVLGLLAKIGALQPEVFVDSVDLKSDVSSVALKLGGRIFCSTSARR